ncbi:MAG: DNA repair protein RecO [Pseudomonadota bacterium]
MSTEHRVQLQPAHLLHRKPYRDSSLLLEAFTPEYGRLGLVARGARSRRSSSQGLLQPFQPLLLSWSGRGELQTLIAVEATASPPALQGDALLGGFYLNELIMRLLTRHDPHPELYNVYAATLQRIGDGVDLGWQLRLFERELLRELGYGLQLSHEACSDRPLEPRLRYCYHIEHGPQRLERGDDDCIAVHGATLLALNDGVALDERCQKEAKRLMRAVLQRYLGPRPLASRELFRAKYMKPNRNPSTDANEE